MDCPFSDSYNQWRWDFWLLTSFKTLKLVKQPSSRIILFLCAVATYIFFKTPWIFPIILIVGGAAGYFFQ